MPLLPRPPPLPPLLLLLACTGAAPQARGAAQSGPRPTCLTRAPTHPAALAGAGSEPRVVCQTGMIDLDIKRGPWLDWCAWDGRAGRGGRGRVGSPSAVHGPPSHERRCRRQLHCAERPAHRLAPCLPARGCRGQSEEECPHYTNLSFELFSIEHIKQRRLVNTCGDASPDYPDPLAPEPGEEGEEGAAPEDSTAPDDGAAEGEEGEAAPGEEGAEEVDASSELVAPSAQVLDGTAGGAATRPFTPGREPEEEQ